MVSGSQWGFMCAKAEHRAERKYPNQPERARQMSDGELGCWNGPYALEPLTILQRIEVLIDGDSHERDPYLILTENFLAIDPWKITLKPLKRFVRLMFSGRY